MGDAPVRLARVALSEGAPFAGSIRRRAALDVARVLGMPGFTAWYGMFALGSRTRGNGARSGAAARRQRGSPDGGDRRAAASSGSAGSEEKVAWLASSGSTPPSTTGSRRRVKRSRSWLQTGSTSLRQRRRRHLEAAIVSLRTHGRVVAWARSRATTTRRHSGAAQHVWSSQSAFGYRASSSATTSSARRVRRGGDEWVREGRLSIGRSSSTA